MPSSVNLYISCSTREACRRYSSSVAFGSNGKSFSPRLAEVLPITTSSFLFLLRSSSSRRSLSAALIFFFLSPTKSDTVDGVCGTFLIRHCVEKELNEKTIRGASTDRTMIVMIAVGGHRPIPHEYFLVISGILLERAGSM